MSTTWLLNQIIKLTSFVIHDRTEPANRKNFHQFNIKCEISIPFQLPAAGCRSPRVLRVSVSAHCFVRIIPVECEEISPQNRTFTKFECAQQVEISHTIVFDRLRGRVKWRQWTKKKHGFCFGFFSSFLPKRHSRSACEPAWVTETTECSEAWKLILHSYRISKWRTLEIKHQKRFRTKKCIWMRSAIFCCLFARREKCIHDKWSKKEKKKRKTEKKKPTHMWSSLCRLIAKWNLFHFPIIKYHTSALILYY